jgi:hypothetical protein
MADINIERKRKSPLPWILGLLVLALLAFLLMRSCGDDDPEPTTTVVTDTMTAVTSDTTMAPMAAPMDTTPRVTTDSTVAVTPDTNAAATTDTTPPTP